MRSALLGQIKQVDLTRIHLRVVGRIMVAAKPEHFVYGSNSLSIRSWYGGWTLLMRAGVENDQAVIGKSWWTKRGVASAKFCEER